MKVRGDIEHVNLATGEKFQRVSGDGESRLERIGEPLTEQQKSQVEAAMKEAQRVIEEHERQLREEPRKTFISGALQVGFTDGQAAFLWNAIPRDREWRA